MRTTRAVTVIQPTISRIPINILNISARKRVAAYARVSTDTEEQLTSYDAQVDYYNRQIHANAEWEFVEVYTDVDRSYGQNPKRP